MAITTVVASYGGGIPARTDDQITFNINVNDILSYMGGPLAAEINAVALEMNELAVTVNGYEESAATSAFTANVSANIATSAANLLIYNPLTAYIRGQFVLATNNVVYLCASDTLAGDDPVTNINGSWEQYSLLKLIPVIKTSDFTFILNEPTYVDTALLSIYGSAPTTPTLGAVILFSDYNSTWGDNAFFVKYTDELLMGKAEDMEIANANQSAGLRFVNSTVGWRLF